ncbi:MAG: 4'-phosphopantetheinyl transferase superfamily protein [Pseudomonadota bacterium]
MMSSRYCGGPASDRPEGIGSIRFIGGFPQDTAVAAYPYSRDHRDVHDVLRVRLLLAVELAEASSYGKAFPKGDSHSLRGELEIESDDLGAPHLVIRGAEGPGISFSYSRDTLWAALCGRDCRCGIDAAAGGDFSGDYPFHRAFGSNEIENFLPVAGGNRAEAAALVWSAKEALVKALGCAFHLMDPLRVRVGLRGLWGEAVLLTARVESRCGEKPAEGSLQAVSLAALPVQRTWVSVAVTDRNGRACVKSRRAGKREE